MNEAICPHVRVDHDGGVLTLELARPDKKNALSAAMYGALADALARAEREPGVRAVLLTAAGDTFCAGNDLAEFARLPPPDEGSPVVRFLTALAGASKPIVAAVDGAAVGVGLTLLLHCDLVYATERARFTAPFVDLGLVPEAASSLLLPRRLGHARAAALLLLGEPLDARAALGAGLVNALLEPGVLRAHALAAGHALARKPPAALRLTKALLAEPGYQTVPARLRHEGALFAQRLGSPEAREAFAAFFEKRPADFSKLGDEPG
jgi:enoyl-CoA hydratase/carnithine racemase